MPDDEHGESGYNNSHRALLQAFIARSVITQDELKPLWAEILSVHEEREISPNDVTSADLTLALSTISAKVSPLDMELRLQPSQTDPSKKYHSIVNLTADPALTGLATTLSTDELAFFRRVLDKMFLRNHSGRREICCVKSTDAVNCAKLSPSQRRESAAIAEENQMSAPKDITLVRAQEVLDELVAQKWLSRSRAGYYSLAPRGLLELREWLWETYNRDAEGEELSEPRVKSCVACRGILTVGERCDERDCPTRLHTACATRFWSAMQGQQKCPWCKTDWSGRAKVGELAIDEGTGGGGRGSMTNGREQGVNGRRRSTSSEEEESD